MRLTVRYVTRFRYSSPVWESHNALRACPAEDGRQRLQAYTVEVSPAAPLFTYRDRWGNAGKNQQWRHEKSAADAEHA